jgi:AcrR family transcriptional regulator
MTSRADIPDERRRQLIASARKVIASKGVVNATLRDVAIDAGVSTGIVSYYFHGKQQLITAAVKAAALDFQRLVAKREAGAVTPWERLQAHVLAVFDGPLRQRRADLAFWAECWSEAVRADHIRRAHSERFRAWLSELTAIIDAGQRAGEFSAPEEAKDLATFVVCAIDGLWLHSVVDAEVMAMRGLPELAVKLTGRVVGAPQA